MNWYVCVMLHVINSVEIRVVCWSAFDTGRLSDARSLTMDI